MLADAAQATNNFEVSGCFARTSETRASFGERYNCTSHDSLETLLASDIDGVVVATPHLSHADLVVAAAEAGKHVFVDKPLTVELSEADRAIAAADNAGVVLQVGHNRRRQPANRRIKEWVRSGELGSVVEVGAIHVAPLLFNPGLPQWRRQRVENPVGGMAALGVHQVDTFHYLAGPISGVFVLSHRTQADGEVDDVSSIVFQFASGAHGHLLTSLVSGPAVEVSVYGTEAIARNTADGASLTRQARGSADQESIPIAPLDTIADELDEFARSIRGEAVPETDGKEARRVVAVLEAITESAETGQWASVTYPGD